MMRIVFMGTPAIAAQILDELAKRHEVAGVFTRPDAVRGRGSKTAPSEVKARALALGFPVYEHARFDDVAFSQLIALQPDVVCVVACGMLLPQRALDAPTFGCLNVHASLLPRWRGAAPTERAILAGDELAGISIMRMDSGLDTGDYCEQRSTPLAGKPLAQVENELAALGAEALLEVLDVLERGEEPTWTAQDESFVTYADKLGKGELDLDPALPATDNVRRVLASSEAHPARALIAERPCTVIAAMLVDDAELLEEAKDVAEGDVRWVRKRMLLGTSDGVFELLQVKPDGKRAMDAKAFAAGIRDIKNVNISWGRI